MGGRVVVLGSGAAEMVPAFNCHCPTCEEARRRPELRRRCACALIEVDGRRVLVDVGSPEAVAEAGGLDVGLVLLSHEHVDHLAGLNLLRWSSRRVVVLCSRATLDSHYVRPLASKRPQSIEFKVIEPGEAYRGEVEVVAFRLNHSVPTIGFIVEGAVAYLLDTIGLPEEALKVLRQYRVEVALIDATYGLKGEPVNHNDLSRALEVARAIDPGLAVLTHIAHYAGRYEELHRAVEGVDGVVVSLDGSSYSFT